MPACSGLYQAQQGKRAGLSVHRRDAVVKWVVLYYIVGLLFIISCIPYFITMVITNFLYDRLLFVQREMD